MIYCVCDTKSLTLSSKNNLMEITREQASNFWGYCTLKSGFEFSCYMAMPSFFNVTADNIEDHRRIFHDDTQIKYNAELLASIINKLNLPEDGENNIYVGVMMMARAYVEYIDDQFGNDSYMNPGSFWLICCRIAMRVNRVC